MTKLFTLILCAAAIASFAASANAAVGMTGEIVSVSKSQPAPICCSTGTDAPLQARVWDYNLQVRVGPEIYNVKYDTALNYFPSNLVSGANVGVRIVGHDVYLATPSGDLKAGIVSRHTDRSETASLTR
jgi:hypothetical protein